MNRKIYHIHPFLFALLPVLSLYRANMTVHMFPFSVMIMPAVVSLALTALAMAILSLLLRNVSRAALIVSWFLFLFFSYGHLHNFSRSTPAIGSPYVLDICLGAVFLAGVLIILKVRRPQGQVVTLIAVILLSIPVFKIAVRQLSIFMTAPAAPKIQRDQRARGDLPDIYYLIFDGYGRQDALKRIYDIDNSKLINHLKSRGFYVAPGSYSNYCQTALSLASSLNMRYINSIGDGLDSLSRDRAPLARLIKYNQVQNFLRSFGYRTVALPTAYYPTEITTADEYLEADAGFFTLDEFAVQLLKTTPIPLQPRLGGYRHTILYSIDQLWTMPPSSTPRFVFAHLLIPHPPFIFGPNGEFKYPQKHESRLSAKEFARETGEMVSFTDKVIASVVDTILVRSSRPPIIVIQADHGTPPQVNWEDPDMTDMPGRFCILNAYHLPGGGNELVHPTITPVNTFRLIFDNYFGTSFGRLPDRSYFSSSQRPFILHDVTDKLRAPGDSLDVELSPAQ